MKEEFDTTVPENRKRAKIGDIFNKLEVTKEAFYHTLKGDNIRTKCIECKCVCGNHKIYREDKVVGGRTKSCGCFRNKSNKITGVSKICSKCNNSLDSSMFDTGKSFCKECHKFIYILRTYNLTKDDYNSMLKSQNYGCYICGAKESKTRLYKHLCIDHNHSTGKVRGLLCSRCNNGIGFFEEDINVLEKAILYLKKFNIEPA